MCGEGRGVRRPAEGVYCASRHEASTSVVFLSLVFYPDSSAASLLYTDLFRRLAQEGARITVLCGFPSKDGADLAAIPRREFLDGIEIRRCGLRIQGKRSVVTRALAYGSFLLHAGWELLRLGRGSVVAGGTDPPVTPIALWLLSYLGRFQYDCLLHDIYPDGLIAIGALRAGHPLARLWRRLNRWSFRRARRVLVIGRDMAALLDRVYGVSGDKVIRLPLWASSEVDLSDTATADGLLHDLGLRDKFVIQYSGNMGLWHDVETLVRAADLLRDHGRTHFLFIGKGRRRQGAEDLARALDLDNVTWLDFLPRERLGESLRACHVALVSFREGLEGVALPSKLYGILAAGRAVIGQVPAESEVAFVVEEERCGIIVPPNDARGLADAIRSLADDPALVEVMGTRAYQAYRSKYTIDHAVRALRGIWGFD